MARHGPKRHNNAQHGTTYHASRALAAAPVCSVRFTSRDAGDMAVRSSDAPRERATPRPAYRTCGSNARSQYVTATAPPSGVPSARVPR